MANKIWWDIGALTGGGATALDYLDGLLLTDGDIAHAFVSGVLYFYKLNGSSSAAENSPLIIAPKTNPGTKRWELQGLYITTINGLTLAVIAGGTTGFTLAGGAKTATISGDVTLGQAWTTPAFSAGDFTASGSQTWTVEEADVVVYAYIIQGKIMTVVFRLDSTTVGGSASYGLRIKIPDSKVATKTMYNTVYVSDNTTKSVGLVNTIASAAYLEITLLTGANWAAATNATSVMGQISFEIN